MSYDNYDLLSSDPYLISGSSCLINHLNLKDTASLNEAEAAFSKITLASLIIEPVEPSWDLSHLQEIHRRIFVDVYPFAGEIRRTEISKSNKLFLPFAKIQARSDEAFAVLNANNLFQRQEPSTWSENVGKFMGVINLIHPFREGNGRAQRVLIDQIARLNGYVIEWAAISESAMGIACLEARTFDQEATQLCKLLRLNLKS